MNPEKLVALQRVRAALRETFDMVREADGAGAPSGLSIAAEDIRAALGLLEAGADELAGDGEKDQLASTFVLKALGQAGKPYVFGAEVKLEDPSPAAFDCSELVQWAAHQVGVPMPDGTMFQLPYCQNQGTVVSVSCALRVRGALLFRAPSAGMPGHVAISLGDGRTVEARGKDYGVGVFPAHNRGWTAGALVPGMRY